METEGDSTTSSEQRKTEENMIEEEVVDDEGNVHYEDDNGVEYVNEVHEVTDEDYYFETGHTLCGDDDEE